MAATDCATIALPLNLRFVGATGALQFRHGRRRLRRGSWRDACWQSTMRKRMRIAHQQLRTDMLQLLLDNRDAGRTLVEIHVYHLHDKLLHADKRGLLRLA